MPLQVLPPVQQLLAADRLAEGKPPDRAAALTILGGLEHDRGTVVARDGVAREVAVACLEMRTGKEVRQHLEDVVGKYLPFWHHGHH